VKIEEAAGPDVLAAVGSVADLVRSVALRKRADLVVIGRGCHTGLDRLRSHAYSIIREAPCPVLSV
jgi:nucleotide-binding universal stress UspA family protein